MPFHDTDRERNVSVRHKRNDIEAFRIFGGRRIADCLDVFGKRIRCFIESLQRGKSNHNQTYAVRARKAMPSLKGIPETTSSQDWSTQSY